MMEWTAHPLDPKGADVTRQHRSNTTCLPPHEARLYLYRVRTPCHRTRHLDMCGRCCFWDEAQGEGRQSIDYLPPPPLPSSGEGTDPPESRRPATPRTRPLSAERIRTRPAGRGDELSGHLRCAACTGQGKVHEVLLDRRRGGNERKTRRKSTRKRDGRTNALRPTCTYIQYRRPRGGLMQRRRTERLSIMDDAHP